MDILKVINTAKTVISFAKTAKEKIIGTDESRILITEDGEIAVDTVYNDDRNYRAEFSTSKGKFVIQYTVGDKS